MKKIAIILISAFLLNLGLVAAPVAYAANEELKEATFPVSNVLKLPGEGEQPTAYFEDQEHSPIVSFILRVINYATAVIGSIAIILLIVAGFMMMFSQGNQQKLDEAKDIFKYAVIGLLVTFLAYVIVIFVQSIFIAE